MKSLGRTVVLIMAVTLAAVLTACGGSSSSGSTDSSSSASSSAAASAESSSAAESAEAPSTEASAEISSAAESAEAPSAAASAPASPVSTYKAGVVSGDTYTNEYFGVKYVLPEGFVFQDEEVKADLQEKVGQVITDEKMAEALESGKMLYDMLAASESGSNINVVIQYTGVSGVESQDVSALLEGIKEEMVEYYENSGMTVNSFEVGTYKNEATGDEYPASKMNADVFGATLDLEQVMIFADGYLMIVTATSADEAELDAMLCNLTRI